MLLRPRLPHAAARVVTRAARRSLSGHASLVTTRSAGEHGEVAVLQMDDGKMNAFSSEMISQLHTALDGASDAGAVVLGGNSKAFSAGFDLSVMGTYPSTQSSELLSEGAELVLRLLQLPQPLVMAVPGHVRARALS